jgi:S-adenosyl-L-methionine hydrolase (adenosine-forming)
MPRPIITLTTDFGTDSPYVAQMKGVILSINREIEIVDITHQVPPQDVRRAALVLAEVAPRFPRGSLHICVVDPGVGTDREIVFVQIGTQFFIAPDNGVLSRLLRHGLPRHAVKLRNQTIWLHPVSDTFHGRDIMAPVAACFVSGAHPELFGPPIERLQTLDWPEPQIEGRQVRGCVLYVDSFGNLITNIDRQQVEQLSGRREMSISCARRTIRGIVRTYGRAAAGSLVALIGSNGLLEIAVVQGNAARQLGAESGQEVVLTG